MGTQTKITWNHNGFEQILTSAGTMDAVNSAAEAILNKANAANTRGGEGFQKTTKISKAYGSMRALALVHTTDKESCIAEAEDHALSQAVTP